MASLQSSIFNNFGMSFWLILLTTPSSEDAVYHR